MGSTGFTNPPLPTNDGGQPSTDPLDPQYWNPIPGIEMAWNWLKGNSKDVGQTLGSIYDQSQKREKDHSFLAQMFNFFIVAMAEGEAAVMEKFVEAEATVYQGAAAPLAQAAAIEADVALNILLGALSPTPGGEGGGGTAGMAAVAQKLFTQIILPFTLTNAGLSPATV